jgi:hypothetical protein
MNKTAFFQKYGNTLVQVNSEDDVETGMFQLFSPEENDKAKEYLDKGYCIASVFENESEEDLIIIDNDTSSSFHKIGFLVLNILK